MKNFKYLSKIKELYENGGNILHFLRTVSGGVGNFSEDILISYDFQSGSYLKYYSDQKEFRQIYGAEIAATISGLGKFDTVLEVGVGEATTLGPVLQHLPARPELIYGLDISWSRLKFAKEYLTDLRIHGVNLFAADLFSIPLPDSSVELIFTSHALEPNGGREEAALKELYRVSSQYVILLEPAYELASEEAKDRMLSHGYVRGLNSVAERVGFEVVDYSLFKHSAAANNPTGLLILRKETKNKQHVSLECPIQKVTLKPYGDSFLASVDGSLVYPILDGIPLLLGRNSILATHLRTNYVQFKTENEISIP